MANNAATSEKSSQLAPLPSLPILQQQQHRHLYDAADDSSDSPSPDLPSMPYPPSQTMISTTLNTHPERELPGLAPVDGGLKAWSFVGCAALCEALYWGGGFSFGVFQDYYTTTPPLNAFSSTEISLIGTIYLAVGYSSGIPLMWMTSKWPHRTKASMYLGVALNGLSLVLASFTKTASQLIIFQGLLPGTGTALLTYPLYTWLMGWFVARRGLATGVVIAGGGVGGTILPFILKALLDRLGYRWTLRILGIASLTMGAIAIHFCNPRIPTARRAKSVPMPRFDISFLWKSSFLGISFATFFQSLGYFNIGVFLPTFSSSLGLSQGAAILATFNLLCVAGQVIWGILADRMVYSRAMSYSAFISSLTAFLLWGFSERLVTLLIFAILFGLASGGYSSIWASAAGAVANERSHSYDAAVIFAAIAISRGAGAVLGPTLGSKLYKGLSPDAETTPINLNRIVYGVAGSRTLILFVGGCLLASSLLSLVFGYSPALMMKLRERQARQGVHHVKADTNGGGVGARNGDSLT